jgi:hypothetical protein
MQELGNRFYPAKKIGGRRAHMRAEMQSAQTREYSSPTAPSSVFADNNFDSSEGFVPSSTTGRACPDSLCLLNEPSFSMSLADHLRSRQNSGETTLARTGSSWLYLPACVCIGSRQIPTVLRTQTSAPCRPDIWICRRPISGTWTPP